MGWCQGLAVERFFSLWLLLKDGLALGLGGKTAPRADGELQARDHGDQD